MSSCQIISGMLPEYISKNTTREQNAEIARHLASCLECRADFALWLSVERSVRQSVKTPDFQAMFDKIPDTETELEKIIKTGSYTMAADILRYTFSTVRETYELANILRRIKI